MKRVLRVLLLVGMLAVLSAPATADEPLHTAASILRGEAAEDCERCRELTACALADDMARGVVLRSRWYGWRAARPQDVALIEEAVAGALCERYPRCRFVGNGRDLEVWARRGWVGEDPVVAYCGAKGCTVCVPLQEPEQVPVPSVKHIAE